MEYSLCNCCHSYYCQLNFLSFNLDNKLNKTHKPKESIALSVPSESRENMNDELNKVLKLYREKNHNRDIQKTPEIFIQPTSSSADVKRWLKGKGFSDYIVTKFGF